MFISRCLFVRSRSEQENVDSCVFELVCAQCLDGCQSVLTTVDFKSDMIHVCDAIPEGVQASSPRITIETFDLKEGYYRVNAESSEVLECFQENSCVGGMDANNYCATGYKGPCK